MMKFYAYLVIFMMVISPFLYVWTTGVHKDGFDYNLKVAPLYFYYGVTSKTYGNETKFDTLFNMTEREWYGNITLRSKIRGMAVAGLVYFILSVVGAIIYYVGIERRSDKVRWLGFALHGFGFIIFLLYLLGVIYGSGHEIYRLTSEIADMPSIGMFLPLLSGFMTLLLDKKI